MSEWQPIETAPKDGTDILVWSDKVPDDEQPQIVRWWDDSPGYWGLAWDCSLWYDTSTPPTYWMPLPKRPLHIKDTVSKNGGL